MFICFPPHSGKHFAEVDRREGRRDSKVTTAMVTPPNGVGQDDGRKRTNRQTSPTPQQKAGHTAAKEGEEGRRLPRIVGNATRTLFMNVYIFSQVHVTL